MFETQKVAFAPGFKNYGEDSLPMRIIPRLEMIFWPMHKT